MLLEVIGEAMAYSIKEKPPGGANPIRRPQCPVGLRGSAGQQ
jgi:hypothetical protein